MAMLQRVVLNFRTDARSFLEPVEPVIYLWHVVKKCALVDACVVL